MIPKWLRRNLLSLAFLRKYIVVAIRAPQVTVPMLSGWYLLAMERFHLSPWLAVAVLPTLGSLMILLGTSRFADRISFWLRRLEAKPFKNLDDIKMDAQYVLYLRTFRTDAKAASLKFGLEDSTRIRTDMTTYHSEEELLAFTMKRAYGEVIALGDPEDMIELSRSRRFAIPYAGAKRLYVPDDEWRDAVKLLAGRASLVMVQVKEGRHTEWELEYVAKHVDPGKILLLLPMVPPGDRFKERIVSFFSGSPSLENAYQAYHAVASLRSSVDTSRVWRNTDQSEFFAVMYFNANLDAQLTFTKRWDTGVPFDSQNLVYILGLENFFALGGLPRQGSVSNGLGHDCCYTSMADPHERLLCLKSTQECNAGRQRLRDYTVKFESKGYPKWPLYQLPYCCPLCLEQRKSKGLD
jgi:hypothetical protein